MEASTSEPLQALDEELNTAERIRILSDELRAAVSTEEYSEAARLRDEIESVKQQDPLLRAEKDLEQAIAEERYEDAARLRDEIAALQPVSPPSREEVPCKSDTVTRGVRVCARSVYVPDRSCLEEQRYFFAYRITITNESQSTVQLLNRHWVIRDKEGRMAEVSGPGVVGEKPVLEPGAQFEYTSACPLRTPSGYMAGTYKMALQDGALQEDFFVEVGCFGLDVNNNPVELFGPDSEGSETEW